ncbi:sugar phosphate isomerase/epimerase [Thauera aromatica]|uniref:sugar phosphate isomerase/epimerase family protein n=1 Tax=Thauera aromatica TaxID=59405 RepID=UPI001FFC7DA2|nr:sugar phosphate isomerase/epimerase [Thauera aromatica]MCK2086762.1 sugar phosphate isomerase/epimerase [Thauera aromatica]
MPKLAISNLAWTGNDDEMLALLANLGVEGVEVAPGKVAPWDELTTSVMDAFRQRVAKHGLEISSFQAFLFGHPNLQLLGDPGSYAALCKHMDNVCQLASVAGAKVLVFGAPKNRLLLGHPMETARALAIERLSELAEIAEKHNVSLGLEAVPVAYGAEFISSYQESLALVRAVDRPGLVFHLDAGCTCVQGDDIGLAIQETAAEIAHFHISQPQLSDFTEPTPYHFVAANALASVGYDRWLCIEMLETAEPKRSIRGAVDFLHKVYLGN